MSFRFLRCGPWTTSRSERKTNCTRCARSVSCVKACCRPTHIFRRIFFEHSAPQNWKSQKMPPLPGWIPSLVTSGNDPRLLNGETKSPSIDALLRCSCCSVGARSVKGGSKAMDTSNLLTFFRTWTECPSSTHTKSESRTPHLAKRTNGISWATTMACWCTHASLKGSDG